MSIKQKLLAQFSRPSGALGRLVGWLMSIKNRARLRWGLEKLNPDKQHQVLEIGFGPGSFIAMLLKEQGHMGKIDGIEISEVMYQQASRRNLQALKSRQLELHLASVEEIPYAASSFDRIFTSNTSMFWPDAEKGFKEIRRVLKDGGLFCLVLQPYWLKHEQEVREEAERIGQQMRSAGLGNIEIELRAMKPVHCMAITATT